MALQRGLLFDTFYGIASPLDGLQFSENEEFEMRTRIAEYCLAQSGKPYNLNFFNVETEEAFYCSQLVYQAFRQVGIDLNTGLEMEGFPGSNRIVYPQEIWNGVPHRQAKRPDALAGLREMSSQG
jgi:hypothetical protein